MLIIKGVLLQIFIVLLPFIVFNVHYRDKTQNYTRNFIIITGSVSLILSMTFSLSVVQGIIFDARYVILFFGLVFGGVQTGIIFLIEFIVYRFYLGGHGVWPSMMSMAFTFLISIVFYKIYNRASEKTRTILLLIFGIVFSYTPQIVLYLYKPGLLIENHAFNFILVPILHCSELYLLIYLFNKAVSDKNFFINHIEDEKVKTIGHVAASLVHEVRNPLTTMKGFLTLIKQNNMDKEKLERYISISMNEINRTETILSEYLAISKPLTDRQKERVDLCKLLDITMDVMTPYANMNSVQITVDKQVDRIEILANPEEIKQVLVNFVKNAIEACFDMQDGLVCLRLMEDHKHIFVQIEDNGNGMNQDQLKRLGTIYYSTKNSGTGLGLTFSYQAIRAMGGRISVESAWGVGSVFTVIFVKDRAL